ncbi:tetratricopeptide repeat-containing sensor histidine kinase [Runella limosa]|uniref:tetratricopeptide repeat-containing sensor histidine kinase n=1 Tax=Runella limosa TaxID=370978 RepID=UPI000417796B|nr:tetratricopeptide repeat-containing sensor histidine kinase [Runella limosa]
MKIIITLALFIVCSSITRAQSVQDDLQKIIEFRKMPSSFQKDTLLIGTQINLATTYNRLQKLDSVRYWLWESEKMLTKTKWQRGWGFFYRARGQYYVFTLKKDSSVADFIKSIAIWEKDKNWRQAGIASARLGNALLMDLQFDKSLFYLNQALKTFEEHNDYFSQANTLNYMSNVYRSMNNYEKALEIHRRVMQLVAKYKLNPQLIEYKHVATSYLFNNMLDSGRYYFAKAGIDIDKNPEKINDNFTYNRLSEFFDGAGMPEKVVKMANLSLQLAEKNKSVAYARTAHEMLHKSYQNLKNYEQALYHYGKAQQINDSLEKAEVSLKLTQLEMQYQTQKKETQIERQRAELAISKQSLLLNESKMRFLNKDLLLQQALVAQQNADKKRKEAEFKIANQQQKATMEQLTQQNELTSQRQTRNLLLASIAFLMTLAGVLFYHNQSLKRKNKEISASVLKGQTIERKRVAADLHDSLGSTMSSLIYTVNAIDTNKLDEQEKNVYRHLKQMLDTAYNEIRLLSHNLLPEEFEKQGLTEALRYFVRKINQTKTIQFDLSIDPNLGRLSPKIEFELYSICLELINNILKHSKATEAKINLSKVTPPLGRSAVAVGGLNLIISDNGRGFFDNESDGKGIKNVKARIESLNGTWHIQNLPDGGMSSEIVVPI